MIGFLSDLNCLRVVYQSCYYYVYFCLVNFDPFSCIDRMMFLVLCTFVFFFWLTCCFCLHSAMLCPYF